MSDRLCSAAALPRCEDLSPRAEVAEGRARRYNGGMETTAGLAYAVNVTEAPVTVKAKKTDDSTETIKVLESVGQHTFIAMSGETVFDGGSVGLVQGPFDPARALGNNGGAGAPLYTLGSDNTYKLAVSETTAELTRPASATDWFHVRMPMHLHGNNLQHGAGASIFAQGSMLASMSARGFYVEDGGKRVFELDSDATGAVYMAIGGATIALGEDGVAPTTELHSHAFYNITGDAASGFDLSSLSLAAPLAGGVTTARIAIKLTGAGHVGAQVWPVGWNWVNEYQGSAPVLDGGRVYYIAVERFGDYINAHLSHSNAI